MAVVQTRYTYPTSKKILALEILHEFYDYIVCLDAETFILNNQSWPEAAAKILGQKIWHGGQVRTNEFDELKVIKASATELVPLLDRPQLAEATAAYTLYSWWWDLPCYDCRHVPGFLQWIEWWPRDGTITRLSYHSFDHLIYQYYTILYHGFSLQVVPALIPVLS